MWGPIIGAAIGGIASARGAAKQQAFSAAQAQKQMDFQERMSSTAYQRAAKDLESAGLNRILALGSPASSPGGAMAQGQNILGAGVNSAVATANATSQIRNQQLQGDIIAPEAHRARLLLKLQKSAEKGVRRGAKTFPYPDPGKPGRGEPLPDSLANTPGGRKFTEFMNRLNDMTMGRSSKSGIETPASGSEVRQGSIQQHIEEWAYDYEDRHGRKPTEKEIRAEWKRVEGLY